MIEYRSEKKIITPQRPLINDLSFNYSSCYSEKPDINKQSGIEAIISQCRYMAKKGRLYYRGREVQLNALKEAPFPIQLLRKTSANLSLQALLTKQHIDDVLEMAHKRVNNDTKRIALTRNISDQTKGISWNFLAPAYLEKIRGAMKKSFPDLEIVDTPIMRVNNTERNSANPVQRILKQPEFEIPSEDLFQNGDLVLFVDEHVQSAGLVLGLHATVKGYVQKEIEMLGVTSLTAHPETQGLAPDEKLVQRVVRKFSQKGLLEPIQKRLMKSGVSWETLVNRDLFTLLAALEGTGKEYQSIMQEILGNIPSIIEGKEDNREEYFKNNFGVDIIKKDFNVLL